MFQKENLVNGKMVDILKIVRNVFSIPEWYRISDNELKRLKQNIKDASCPEEARFFTF